MSRPVIRAMVLVATLCGAAAGHGQEPPRAAEAKASKPDAKARERQAADRAKARKEPGARAKARSAPPQVLSRAESDARRKKRQLRMPGALPEDRYNPDETDWTEIPAWRQTSFYGLRARGQFFVFVIDQSGSMIDDDRMTRAKIELRRSVFALQPPQRFEVIVYNNQATAMPGGPIPRPADQRHKEQLTTWLRLIDPDGETNPRSALRQALALRPDAVFLLSDGEFPGGTVEAVSKLNTHGVPIHCVDLTGGLAGDDLERIARQNGGQYASRPGSLHAKP